MNINIIKNNCCGCRACEFSCPFKAISFIYNDEGFLVPKINEKLCTNCGLCLKFCHVQNQLTRPTFEKKYYSFTNPNEVDLLNSASGGFACYLIRKYLENGDYVCACILDNNYPRYILTNDIKYLEKIQSSKYVQADTCDCLYKVKRVLQQNKKVLFVGTPCYVASLKTYLRQDYDNLTTIDLICHGVPSTKLFIDYVDYLERIYKSKISNFNFRYKYKKRWGHYRSFVTEKNKKIHVLDSNLDKYCFDFVRFVNYRESCYSCKYANLYNRQADFTIGDHWNIYNNKKSKHYNSKGVSSVIINTKKGFDAINLFQLEDYLQECTLDCVLQDNLTKPTMRIKERDSYYSNYKNYLFWNKKGPSRLKYYFMCVIRKYIPKKIRKAIKGIIKR